MKWIFISIICVISPRLHAESPTPMGRTTHIATAPNNPSVVAAIINRHIWVSLDGGQTWLITASLSHQRRTLPENDASGDAAPTRFLANDPGEDNAKETDADDAEETGTQHDNRSEVHLAVANNGDVTFWQRKTRQVSNCPIASACVAIARATHIRDIAVDSHDIVWVALPNQLVGYTQSRRIANYQMTDMYGLLLSAKGAMMAVTVNGVFELPAHPADKIRPLHSTSGLQAVATLGSELFICQRGQISKMDPTGQFQPLMRLRGCPKKLVVTRETVWARHTDHWIRMGVRLGAAPGLLAPEKRPMPDVLDVAKDARGNIWLGTTAGPIKARVHATAQTRAISETCRFGPSPVFQAAPPTPLLPRPDAPMRSLLPQIRLWVRIGDTATIARTPHRSFLATTQKALQMGVFFVWRTRTATARATQMHEQIFKREHRWRQRQQQVMAEFSRERLAECGAWNDSTDPLQSAILQLQKQKWETWRRYNHWF